MIPIEELEVAPNFLLCSWHISKLKGAPLIYRPLQPVGDWICVTRDSQDLFSPKGEGEGPGTDEK
jgi:hypothetical protein